MGTRVAMLDLVARVDFVDRATTAPLRLANTPLAFPAPGTLDPASPPNTNAGRPRGTRVQLIDGARGLFVFWMVTAHGLGLAGVYATSWLGYLLPPDSIRLSERFVFLSGFTIAWVAGTTLRSAREVTLNLWRRGLQLVVLAYLSNILSAASLAVLQGTSVRDAGLEGILAERPWSISWTLLPTAILLSIAPVSILVWRWMGTGALLTLTATVTLLAGGPATILLTALESHPSPAVSHLQAGDLLRTMGIGAWTLALGLCARGTPILAFVTALACAGATGLCIESVLGLPAFAAAMCRIGLLMGGVALLYGLPLPGAVREPFELLGRNALLVFMAHRFIEQVLTTALRARAHPEIVATVTTATTLLALVLMARTRESSPMLSRRLGAIGL